MIGILYLAGAVLAFGLGRYVHRELLEKRAWPTVQGRMLERGLGERMSAAMGPGRFLPGVKYSYTVNGTDYVGDQCYAIRGTGGLDHEILDLVNNLPDPVPVHYNPADPKQAYLIANPIGTYWILVGFAILAALIGLSQLLPAVTKP